MKYLLTIYIEEAGRQDRTPEEGQKAMAAWDAYTREVRERGALLGGEGLQPVETATTVRFHEGERSVTDGPFAETREQLGGFYLLECNDLDEAMELAEKIPISGDGSVEVRPVMDYEAAGSQEHAATADPAAR
jgi:hypothetical protein